MMSNYNFESICENSRGRCGEIIAALTPLPSDVVQRGSTDHPCPVCDGKTVIWPSNQNGGADQHGRIACRNCTDNKPTGDIIDTVKVFGRLASQGDAAQAVAEYLGVATSDTSSAKPAGDIIEMVAKAKRVSSDALRQFGAKPAKRNGAAVARFDVYDERGEVHSHFDLMPNGKGKFKYGKGTSGMFFPGRLPNPGERWLLVEGMKDAAALQSIGYNAAGMPSNRMPKQFGRLFHGVDVILVPDLDNPGQSGAQLTGGHLAGYASTIRLARLPGEIVQKGGDDVRDVLQRDGAAKLRKAIQEAESWVPRGDEASLESKPEVVQTHSTATIDEALKHLGNLGWDSPWIEKPHRDGVKVYQRGGLLVEPVTTMSAADSAKGKKVKVRESATRIRELPEPQLTVRVADACQLVTEKENQSGEFVRTPVKPSGWLIKALATRGHYGDAIRPLEALVNAPTLRPDGSVLQKPGWDASGLLYKPSGKFPKVPDKPTLQDARDAVELIRDVVADFPFAGEHHFAAWLSMLASMVARPAIAGPVPLFVFMANTQASGKSKLIDVASLIAYGEPAARKTYPGNEDEMRKVITATLLAGVPLLMLDNIHGTIGSGSLEALLTSTSWTDRDLGTLKTLELPAKIIVSATGNNVQFNTDTGRRAIMIRLESPHDCPEERTDFKYPDLFRHVSAHRGELVRAVLTVVRAYFVAGHPEQPGPQFGSFEEWRSVIRNALVWAGCADPLETKKEIQENDESKSVHERLIAGLQELDETGEGYLASKIIETLEADDARERFPVLYEIVMEVGTPARGKPSAKILGKKLGKYHRKRINGRMIDFHEKGARRKYWYVADAPSSDSGDSSETVNHQDNHQAKTRDLRSKNGIGDSGESLFSFPGERTEEPTSKIFDSSGQVPSAMDDPANDESPKSPQSPSSEMKCPRCGESLMPAEPIGGYRNWDCSAPDCPFVRPLPCDEHDDSETPDRMGGQVGTFAEADERAPW